MSDIAELFARSGDAGQKKHRQGSRGEAQHPRKLSLCLKAPSTGKARGFANIRR